MTTPPPATPGNTRGIAGFFKGLRNAQRPLDAPNWLRWGTLATVIVVGVILPLNSPTFVNFDLSMVMIYAIVGLGLNLLTGYNGQISLGHSAFFAFGAYVAAVLIKNHEWHYLAVLPPAVIGAWILGYLFGLPALRLRGLQLALVTLALAITTPALIKRLDDITKGQEGINVFLPDPPAWTGLATDQWVYLICFLAVLVTWFVIRRLTTGRVGRSIIGIRSNELVAQTLGDRTSRTKTYVFALSAALAGLGGVLYTYAVQFVGPDSFGLVMAIAFISIVVIGGLGTVSGAIFGAFFIQYIPQWTAGFGDSAAGFTYGLALVVFMFVMPFGIAGLVNAVLRPLIAKLPGKRSIYTPPAIPVIEQPAVEGADGERAAEVAAVGSGAQQSSRSSD